MKKIVWKDIKTGELYAVQFDPCIEFNDSAKWELKKIPLKIAKYLNIPPNRLKQILGDPI